MVFPLYTDIKSITGASTRSIHCPPLSGLRDKTRGWKSRISESKVTSLMRFLRKMPGAFDFRPQNCLSLSCYYTLQRSLWPFGSANISPLLHFTVVTNQRANPTDDPSLWTNFALRFDAAREGDVMVFNNSDGLGGGELIVRWCESRVANFREFKLCGRGLRDFYIEDFFILRSIWIQISASHVLQWILSLFRGFFMLRVKFKFKCARYTL